MKRAAEQKQLNHILTMEEKKANFRDFLFEIESHIRFSQNKLTTGMLHTTLHRYESEKKLNKKEIALF